MVDAAGRYVFPGLIDAHAHMFQEGTEIGIYPDVAYLPTGVTSAIDFSAGVANYPIFRSAVIARSRVTIKSFLQVCSAGLTTTSYHECINPKFFNAEKIVRMYHDNQDNILGLKIRQSEELAEGLGIEPLKETVRYKPAWQAVRWRFTAPTSRYPPVRCLRFCVPEISLNMYTRE